MKVEEGEKGKWIALLRGVKFFDGFENREIELLIEAGSVHHYKFHEFIFKEKQLDFSFFVLLKGSVKLIKLGVLSEQNDVGKLMEGDCFGEMGLLLQTERTASVLAAEECFIFRIDAKDIEKMPESAQKKLYKQFAVSLAQKLKSATENMVQPSH